MQLLPPSLLGFHHLEDTRRSPDHCWTLKWIDALGWPDKWTDRQTDIQIDSRTQRERQRPMLIYVLRANWTGFFHPVGVVVDVDLSA